MHVSTGRYPVRFNLRLSKETAEVYEEFAKLSNTDLSTVFRMFLDGSVPAVESMSDALRQVQAGNAERATEIIKSMADLMAAESKHYQVKTEALQSEVNARLQAST